MFYNFIKTTVGIIFKIFYRIQVVNIENIPDTGKIILCSNHASLLDPIFISIIFPRHISWMAKKELFNNRLLAFIIRKLGAFPVDRQGSDIAAIKNSLRVLKEDRVLGIFPEGTRVKAMNLDNAKSGIALLGVSSGSPILPVYIESNYKIFNRVKIYIGKPIFLFDEINGKLSSDDYLNMSKSILTRIYELPKLEGN